MKLCLIFVAILANSCCHGVSGKSLAGFDEPMDGKDQAGSPRFLPGLPGGQSVSQSGSNSAPSTPSSTNFQPTKFQLIEKFKEFLTNLEDQLQVSNENLNLEPKIQTPLLLRNPRIGDARNKEGSHTFEMVIRSRMEEK